jgi:hypothetical protein
MSQSRVFRIGTFNLYNLIQPGVTYYGNKKLSKPMYERKIGWIAGQLRSMNAAVVGFQECFQSAALQQAIASSGLYNGASVVTHERKDNNNQPLPCCGLVSLYPVVNSFVIEKFPPRAVVSYGGQTVPIDTFSRPVVYARVQVNEHLVHVFVAHLKSKRPTIMDGEDRNDPVIDALGKTRSLITRAAEAIALRTMVVDITQNTQAPCIVLGDLNDETGAVTNEVISGSQPWRFAKFAEKKKAWDVLLYNVRDIISKRSLGDYYYTHIYQGHYGALDHLLVSEEFVYENRDGRIGAVESVRLFNDHLVDDTQGDDDVPAWQSDHGQVVAQITLDAPKPPPSPAAP